VDAWVLMGNTFFKGLFGPRDEIKTLDRNLLVEQYAIQVLDFATQYGSDFSYSYTAANCLGVPSKFPNYGDFPQTYVMRSFGHWNAKVKLTIMQ